jgi:hypothetical protein
MIRRGGERASRWRGEWAVDIGGTFTDVALVDEKTGRIGVTKVPTTPRDFAEGVINGIRQGLARCEVDPAEVSLLSHATTIVTNALLEKKGARAGFVTTRGFRDVLELRRSSRADLYDLFQDAPAVLVPRRWRFEVTERIDAQGQIVTPLDERDIDGVIAAIRDVGLETVAVSLLFSFLNDTHERILGERLRHTLPGVGIYLSSEVLPEIREFERASTTAVCVYVGPLLANYLERLQSAVSTLGLPQLYVMGSMPDAMRAVIAAFPEVEPGDVFIHNDPYHGGSHLPDVNVVAPAFSSDRLLGFGCVRAHWPDIGSATPGSYAAVTEIYGEGLRLPPMRLYRNGQPNRDIERIIFANVRAPSERQGDLRAQVAANRRGALRLEELARKYGPDELLRIMDEVLDYSETMMRAALRLLPDGEASFADVFDGNGVIAPGVEADEPFSVRLTIRKRGDTITADFAASDGQVPGPMNAPLTVIASGGYCALKMIADPKSRIPPNSGCWRPVTVTAPPGSVVNAQPPALVVYANHEISHRAPIWLWRQCSRSAREM